MGKSPPESGGDPSRSEGGAVCSKFARSAFHINFREAILVLIGALREYPQGARCARTLNRPPLRKDLAAGSSLPHNICVSTTASLTFRLRRSRAKPFVLLVFLLFFAR